ncbi:AAA family ATPase [Faecalibacterium sp. 9]|uniref:AAA family ATPase n=1 Tax=Faecalibacterium sp. 9 TaxID=3402018 RepID=UPI003AAF9539
MAYTDDWENLMNGVFGAGGRPRFGGTAQPEAKPQKSGTSAVPDLNAALLENQKQLDALLKKQNAQLRTKDDAVQSALKDSRQMLRDMEADGLLAKGTADLPAEQLGSFEGLAAEVKKTVLGQDAFVDSVVRAMRRPFVLGTERPAARNVILICGGAGTGRHFALEETARIMAARGLLQSDKTAVVDLALYPNSGAEKLFLQDLYAALHAPGEIVIFEHYESCHPGFLKMLSDLAVKGSAPLSSRYLVNKEGILVDAGTALAPGAVSSITPCGKYLFFFSRKGRDALADKFGAPFVAAVGDVCVTSAFAREDLAALAAQQLNALAQKVSTRLGLTLCAGADVRDYVAARCTKEKGAAGLAEACDEIFRALSEYCLQTDAKLTGTVTLTAKPEGVWFSLNGGGEQALSALLPAEYTGAAEAVRAELDSLVGLGAVKEYVFGLADNLQVQQRRAAAGFKTASLSMHMIFTGNPGTGKTTIARLVAKYLKAIGALKGGQLVEVTRADLVGRYTGHTAPLTNSVIESALGGVLFIDEAYSLYRGEQDSFGLEAIDTLVKGMEDHRDELVVVLAGYTREMEVFLTANSGLASRFPNKIEFPDYTADELLDITNVLAKGKGYRLAEGCTFPLLGYYKRRQALDSRTAGNGRLARNTLEKAIFHQSRRLVAEPDAELDLILPGDLEFEE